LAAPLVHAELMAHQVFHMRHLALIDGAIGLSQFGAKPENVKNKLPLPPLIGFELTVRAFFLLGLIKKIMPKPRPHKKADQSAKWDAQEVEQKDAGDAAEYFAFDFHCVGWVSALLRSPLSRLDRQECYGG